MRVIGNLSDEQVHEIVAATKRHPAFESGREIRILHLRDDQVVEVWTIPEDYSAPASWERNFFVRLTNNIYVVDETYADLS
jgi:hypothetical protein